MGLPVLPNDPPLWTHKASPNEIRSLAGNGMSSPMLGAIILHLLTHLEPAHQMPQPIHVSAPCDNEEQSLDSDSD